MQYCNIAMKTPHFRIVCSQSTPHCKDKTMGSVQSFMEKDNEWSYSEADEFKVSTDFISVSTANKGTVSEEANWIRADESFMKESEEDSCKPSSRSKDVFSRATSSDQYQPASDAKETMMTHISEASEWKVPVSRNTTPLFSIAAKTQKDYTRESNFAHKNRESADEISERRSSTASEGKKGLYIRDKRRQQNLEGYKYNSCSTLYVESTLSNSDLYENVRG
jgi:hypothetical protein